MSLPRVYRDPVHGQIKFERIDLKTTFPVPPRKKAKNQPNRFGDKQLGWLIPNLISTVDFQRLRHIRQNGLTNLVFHGAEHSRFSHSMGVMFLAREMYDRISTTTNVEIDEERRLATVAAGLLHDLGHGPFSHAIEEIIGSIPDGPKFHHEEMTRRIIEEEGTPVNRLLREVDSQFPSRVASYIDKTKPRPGGDHWSYRIISSQLDADRLDYLLRDARHTGLQGHGFDLARLLDMLEVLGERYVAVNRGALEAVEAYLVMLEQVYRAVYFHHASRAATTLLTSVLQRAVSLYNNGDQSIFPLGASSPLPSLIREGQNIDLAKYRRLGEFQIWALIDQWQDHDDPVLKDLSERLIQRHVFKYIDLDTAMPIIWAGAGTEEMIARVKQAVIRELKFCDESTADLYVVLDHPDRISYKSYDWMPKKPDESIWLCGKNKPPCPLEKDDDSRIISALKEVRRFPRLLFPQEVAKDVQQILDEAAP